MRPSLSSIWLLLSLATAVLYRLPALFNGFSGDYVVQDDARQHVFWMLRFAEPALFPNDLLADYFQSVAPAGYAMVYRGAVSLGLDVWTVNRMLPIVIVLMATAFGFGLALQLFPVPRAGFVTTLFLNQTLLVRDDIDSATPAAFFYPIFLAFLYYVLKGAWLPSAIAIVLMGLFYPQGVLIMAGILGLRLLRWQQGRLQLSPVSGDYWLWATGWGAALLVLLPHALHTSPYGPVVTLAQGKTLFALSSEGWSEFFVDSPLDYWVCGKRSGLFPPEWCGLKVNGVPLLGLIWLVPFGILMGQRSRLPRLSATRLVLLLQVVLASVICFALAQGMLFHLHLPNRYTEHSFRVVGALSLGLVVFWLLDAAKLTQSGRLPLGVRLGLGAWATVPLLIVCFIVGPDLGNYTRGEFPELYAYLKQQPASTLIASLTEETNNLPSFTRRSIFVGAESYTLPYHLGYYAAVKQRTIDLIKAQYSLEPTPVQTFLDTYSVDLWLLDQAAFTPKWIARSQWLRQYAHETDAPQQAIASGQPTVLQQIGATCEAATLDDFVLLEADCLRQALNSASP